MMGNARFRFKIFRYDSESQVSRYDDFEVEARHGMTVLEALFSIQDRQDDSLAFRYSCRGAVCGSCALFINRVPRLACKTQLASLIDDTMRMILKPYPALETPVAWSPEEAILVEPLPHLPIVHDLVVDMERFFECYREIQPFLQPSSSDDLPERERRMAPSAATELEKYTNCILCAACFGACPVNGKTAEYLGPAALAKLYRFHIDPRENRDRAEHAKRLELGNDEKGWWGCEFHTNCNHVCPKGVPPNLAIGRARQQLKTLGKAP